MKINTEFLKSLSDTGSDKSKTTQETKSVADSILELMIANPNITAKEMALNLDITFDGVRYHIKKLKSSGNIKREGPTKSGKWIVLK